MATRFVRWLVTGTACLVTSALTASLVVGVSLPTLDPVFRTGNLPETRAAIRPLEPAGEFRFAFIGDVNNIGYAAFFQLIEQAQEAGAAFIVCGGDTVRHARPLEFRHFLYELEHVGLKVPLFFVTGNHDRARTRSEVTYLYANRILGPAEYSFRYGNSLFLFADPGELWNQPIWEFVRAEIAKAPPEVTHRFLLTHAPPINWPGKLEDQILPEDRVARHVAAARDLGIDAVLSGHVKQFHEEARDGIRIVCAGGGPDRQPGDDATALLLVDVGPENFWIEPRPHTVRFDPGVLIRHHLILGAFGWAVESPWEFTLVLVVALYVSLRGIGAWIARTRRGPSATDGIVSTEARALLHVTSNEEIASPPWPGAPRPSLSIVVPLFNEEENVRPLWNALEPVLHRLGQTYEVLLVNDGSLDATAQRIEALARDHHEIRHIRLPVRQGQSAAFVAGFGEARGRTIVTMDGDLQNDPEDIPSLLERMDRCDIAVGWRRDRRDPLIRRISSRIANYVRNRITGESVHDIGCSLKAFRAPVARSFFPFQGVHRFFPTLARMHGWRVEEVPVRHHPRTRGRAKYGVFNRLLGPLADCLAVAWMKRRGLPRVSAKEVRHGQAA